MLNQEHLHTSCTSIHNEEPIMNVVATAPTVVEVPVQQVQQVQQVQVSQDKLIQNLKYQIKMVILKYKLVFKISTTTTSYA